MAHVFISYSRKDAEFTEDLLAALEQHSFDVWLDREDIPKGAKWWQEICTGIESAEAFVFVISPDSLSSEVCNDEIKHATRHNKRIVPILRRDVNDQELETRWLDKTWAESARTNWYTLRQINWLLFREQDEVEAAVVSLVQTLQTDLDHVRIHTRLTVRAVEWDAHGRQTEYILRGADLSAAERWLVASETKEPIPTTLQTQYVLASAAERQREEIERQTQQARELELQKEATHRQQQAANRLRYLVAALTIFLVVATALSVFAFNQFRTAEREADRRATEERRALNNAVTATISQGVAEKRSTDAISAAQTAVRSADEEQSQALAAAAQVAVSRNDLDLAIALAVEANQISTPPPQAQRMLAEAAYSPGTRAVYQAYPGGLIESAVVRHSPDGNSFITGGCVEEAEEGNCLNAEIFVWDATAFEVTRSWSAHTGDIKSLAYDTTGQRVISTSEDGTAVVWDVATGDRVHTFTGHSNFPVTVAPIEDAQFSPDGRYIITVGGNQAFLWDATTGERAHELDVESDDAYWSAVFSPDGQAVLVGGLNIYLVEVETGTRIRSYLNFSFDTNLGFSPNGRLFATGSQNGVALWDVAQSDPIRRFATTDATSAVIFHPDGQRLISVGGDPTSAESSLIVWDIESGNTLQQMTLGGGLFNYFTGASLHPNGVTLLVSTNYGTLRLYDLENGAILKRYTMPDQFTGGIHRMALSPDHQLAAVAVSLATQSISTVTNSENVLELNTGVVLIVDVATGTVLTEYRPHTQLIETVVFSPDGKWVATGGFDQRAVVYDIEKGETVYQFAVDENVANALAFSPDGKWLAMGSYDSTVVLWNMATGQSDARLETGLNIIEVLRFTADGAGLLVAGAGNEHDMILLNPTTGDPIRAFVAGNELIFSVAFSPNERLLLAGLADGSLLLFDATTGQRVGNPFVGHDSGGFLDAVSAVAFSPDGQLALSGSSDDTLILWDIASGQAIRRFRGHQSQVTDVAFLGDRQALSVGQDNTMLLWRIDNLNELLAWTHGNRYVREADCSERIEYRLEPLCDENQQFVTHTPFPTLTPTFTFTPSPTINLTLTTATPSFTPSPTHTVPASPTPTSTATPSPTPTAIAALTLEDISEEVAALDLPFMPLLPREIPSGLFLYRIFAGVAEVDSAFVDGEMTLTMAFSSDTNFHPTRLENYLSVNQSLHNYVSIREWTEIEGFSLLAQYIEVNGTEVMVMSAMNVILVGFIHEDIIVVIVGTDTEADYLEPLLLALIPPPAAIPVSELSGRLDAMALDFTPQLPGLGLELLGYKLVQVDKIEAAETEGVPALMGEGESAVVMDFRSPDGQHLMRVFESLSDHATLEEWGAALELTGSPTTLDGLPIWVVRFSDGIVYAFIRDGVLVSLFSETADQLTISTLAENLIHPRDDLPPTPLPSPTPTTLPAVPVQSGQPISGIIALNDRPTWSFEAKQGQSLVVENSSVDMEIAVYAPDGTLLVQGEAGASIEATTLPMDGTYLLSGYAESFGGRYLLTIRLD